MNMIFFSSVLEFELRKAQDTIKSLRASLTKEAGNWWSCFVFMLPKGGRYSRRFVCPVVRPSVREPCPPNNFQTTVGI